MKAFCQLISGLLSPKTQLRLASDVLPDPSFDYLVNRMAADSEVMRQLARGRLPGCVLFADQQYLFSRQLVWFVMRLLMDRITQDTQVFRVVVELVMVQMVDMLSAIQWPAQLRFHDRSVLINPPAVNSDLTVATSQISSTLPVWVVGTIPGRATITAGIGAVAGALSSTGRERENSATYGTGTLNGHRLLPQAVSLGGPVDSRRRPSFYHFEAAA